MKMENKRAAQERRAKERAKKQAKQTAINWIITIAIIAVVALVIVLIVRGNTGSKSATNTSSSVSTSSVSSASSSKSTISASSSSIADSASTSASNAKNSKSLNTTAGTVVNKGDTVAIHYVGKTSDGTPFYGGTGDYDLKLGSGSFIPGFEDQVEGHSVGETFDVNVTFPEGYSSTYAMDENGNEDTTKEIDLAGQPAVFTVTINGVYAN